MKSDTRGFTLLELLMVVIIIAILASIALPQYLRVAERSRASEALTVLAAIRSSQLRFKANDPAGLYGAMANLDTDIPGYGVTPNVIPPSPNWTFDDTAGGGGAGTNATATRTGGQFGGNTIEIDLDSGGTCNSNAIWGLPMACP